MMLFLKAVFNFLHMQSAHMMKTPLSHTAKRAFIVHGEVNLFSPQKAEKPIRKVSSTSNYGVRALALPHRWMLLDTWTVGKSMGKPFDGRTRGQLFATYVSYAVHTLNGESPASALP